MADLGSVGAVAAKLERALSLTNTELGLLAAAPAICSALLTVPMGVLVDRANRVRLLWITMLAWSAAQALSGLGPTTQPAVDASGPPVATTPQEDNHSSGLAEAR